MGNQFRLVGGSIKINQKSGWTGLEKSRICTWTKSIENVRLLPISWQQKVQIIQSLMSQLTFGQGTHQLHVTPQNATSLRATVIRALLNSTFYDASPAIIFTVLSKPAIEPVFAMHLAALQLIFRIVTNPDKQKVLDYISDPQATFPVDSPLSRMHQLYHHDVYHQVLHDFLNNRLQQNKWQHSLRDKFRYDWWTKIAKDRAQHFSGIEVGINRALSTALLQDLMCQADFVQQQLDEQHIPTADPETDPRPKLKILRLMLSAGLQTPERDHRHRRRPGTIQCQCGHGIPTIYHISWERACYQDIRNDIWQYLPAPIEHLPVCFQITTLVPNEMIISVTQIKNIQSILIKIWQKQVQLWYDTTESNSTTPNGPVINPASNPSAPNPTSSSPDVNPPNIVPTIKRGHILKLIPTGGVFCCRCGKLTKNQKHQRLKILNKPWRFPDLEPSQWLTTPGFQQSQHRMHEAENLLNSQYNPGKHVLVWNRKLGKIKNKPDCGLLWCSACGRSWAWAQTMSNLKRTTCNPTGSTPTPPDWVTVLEHYAPAAQEVQSNPQSTSGTRRRIVGKQKPNQPDPSHASSTSAAAGSSSDRPAEPPHAGIG